MCRIFSGYATRSGETTGEIYCIPDKTHSHSMIAAVFNLRDSDVSFYAQSLCKFEYIPPKDTKLWGDLNKWELCIDEPGGKAPDWFDREKVIAHMERLVRPMFVTDERNWLVGGCWIFSGDKARCKGVIGGTIAGVINGANLSRANLYRANLDGANLYRANLSGATLSGATLYRANLDGANLYGANLYGATLSGATLDRATLSGANLDGATLSGATLYRANLDGANLDGANLDGANLDGANLYGANLYGANLSRATLDRATLSGANLDRANLSGANLSRATLDRATLSGAYLDGARIGGVEAPDGWEKTADGILIRKVKS